MSGFAGLVCASAVSVSAFRNCVTSKYFVCKQIVSVFSDLTHFPSNPEHCI